jgi:hypothetical protein
VVKNKVSLQILQFMLTANDFIPPYSQNVENGAVEHLVYAGEILGKKRQSIHSNPSVSFTLNM